MTSARIRHLDRALVERGLALALAYVVVRTVWPAPPGVLLQGVLLGSISGLLALGLVLVHRANRIVNFAQADLGVVPAVVALLATDLWGWPILLSLVVGGALSLVVGGAVQHLLIRRFSSAPRLILTVVTIGLSQVLLALGSVMPTVLLGDRSPRPVPAPFDLRFTVHPIAFDGWDSFALLVTPLAVLGLFGFLRRTATGAAIRASAENSERALLLGVPIGRIHVLVWSVASALSFLAVVLRLGAGGGVGVFSVASSSAELLTTALAAAVIGRMERLGVIIAAAAALGVLEQSIIWDTGRSTFATAAQFVILLVALLAQRRGRTTRVDEEQTSSWRAAAAPHPVPREVAALPIVRRARQMVTAAGIAVALLLPTVLGPGRTGLAALVLIYALLGLSLVVLTGWAGQVSLGQASFFGFGGAVGAALTIRSWDLVAGLGIAGVVGAVTATIVGLPALRVRGLYLAVTTLAFSVFASVYLINPETLHWVPLQATFIERRPVLGRISIASEERYYYLCLACFALGLVLVRGFRSSRAGRIVIAMRDNERAAQSYGVNAMRTKLLAFATSGFLAAVSGVLYVHSQQALATSRFTPAESLRVFAMVVIGGVGSVPGALIGSMYLNGIEYFGGSIGTDWLRVLVGLMSTGLGLVVILLVLPGGLGELLIRARDRGIDLLLRMSGEAAAVPSTVRDDRDDRGSEGAELERTRSERRSATPVHHDEALLRMRGVEVGYDGVQVLFGVDLDVHRGEIVALLGTNGAGKSTTLRGITGLSAVDSGTIHLGGTDLTGMAAHQVPGHGVALVPGGRGVFPTLTVDENLMLATWAFRRDRPRVDAALADARRRFPVLVRLADVPAGNLSGGQQQMLALAQTLMTGPKLLMIDELSLGLAPIVVGELIEAVRSMRAEGMTIVLVEQSINVALTVADRAYFMEKGEVRFDGPTADLLDRPDLLRSVFVAGAAAAAPASPTTQLGANPSFEVGRVLAVDRIGCTFGHVRAVDDVSFHVDEGEIVGIIGANGAGKTTVFDLISGFTPTSGGSITIAGVDVTDDGPDERARLGLCRSFQDARLFSGLTVAETLAVAHEHDLPIRDPLALSMQLPAALASERWVRDQVDQLIELLGLGSHRDKFIGELSTGTRRVVDLGCVLAQRPRIVLFDEPSSGVAQREVEALAPLIRRVRDEIGAAVLVIEHDMPLISSVSDRMIAMELGRVIAEGTAAQVLSDPHVIATYLGTDASTIHRSGTTSVTSAHSGSAVRRDRRRAPLQATIR